MKPISLAIALSLVTVLAFAPSPLASFASVGMAPQISQVRPCPNPSMVFAERSSEIEVQETSSMGSSEIQKDPAESNNSDSSADSSDNSADSDDQSEGEDREETQDGETDSPGSDRTVENGDAADNENQETGDSVEPATGPGIEYQSTAPASH
jgi:hypothetical protein